MVGKNSLKKTLTVYKTFLFKSHGYKTGLFKFCNGFST